MIKINLAIPYELQKTIHLAEKKIRDRSFAGRNPHLGKMINCPICDRRHREYPACKPVYSTFDKNGYPYQEMFDGESWQPLAMQATNDSHKGVLGAAMFKRRRINPHHSAMIIRFLTRVREYYEGNLNFTSDVPEAKRQARSRALNEFPRDIRRRLAQAQRSAGASAIGQLA